MKTKKGRPSITDNPATACIHLRVTAAQRLELRRIAAMNQTDVAGLLREAVNTYAADSGDRLPFRRR